MFIKEADLFKEMSQNFMNELAKIMIEESYGKDTLFLKKAILQIPFMSLKKDE